MLILNEFMKNTLICVLGDFILMESIPDALVLEFREGIFYLILDS